MLSKAETPLLFAVLISISFQLYLCSIKTSVYERAAKIESHLGTPHDLSKDSRRIIKHQLSSLKSGNFLHENFYTKNLPQIIIGLFSLLVLIGIRQTFLDFKNRKSKKLYPD